MARLSLALLPVVVLVTGCHEAHTSILLEGAGPNGSEVELCVTEEYAIVHATKVAWPSTLEPRTYVLPTDTVRYGRLCDNLRHIRNVVPGSFGLWRITLLVDGKRVTQFTCWDDAAMFPLCHGLIREIEACARADYAYAFAYREVAEHNAARGEVYSASVDCRSSMDAIEAADDLEFGSILLRNPDTVSAVYDPDWRIAELRGCLINPQLRQMGIEAFFDWWDESVGAAIPVEERGTVVVVTIDGQKPPVPADQLHVAGEE